MGKRDRNNERAWLVDPAVPKHYEADMDFAFNFTCLISNSLVSAQQGFKHADTSKRPNPDTGIERRAKLNAVCMAHSSMESFVSRKSNMYVVACYSKISIHVNGCPHMSSQITGRGFTSAMHGLLSGCLIQYLASTRAFIVFQPGNSVFNKI